MAGFRIDDCTSRRAPGRLVRRIDKAMRALIEGRLASFGITYSQWATLKLVREGVVRTASDLGRELDYTSGASTRLIDILEERGWIERTRDRADRRVAWLSVTPAGHDVADRGMSVAIDMWNGMIADFTQDEADRFVDLLVRLDARIQAQTHVATEAAE